MSELSITDVHVHLLEGPRPWAIVRVRTNTGIEGIGEIPRTRHRSTDIERVGERLLGEDPFETEQLFGAGGRLGAAPNNIFDTTITGGFDMACWDLKGKHLGVPVYDLLGGKQRDTVRAYANGWDFEARKMVERYHDGEDADTVLSDTKAEITTQAERVVEAGYTALKFSPFQWGDGPTVSKVELDNAISVIEAVHQTIPDDVELLIEGHKHLSTERATQAARRLARFDPGFYEEPVPAEIESVGNVARTAPIPIATGESFVTHLPFAQLIFHTDVSVVQPDVGRAGGITELRKVAAMASAGRVGFAPHNAAGPVMTHAAVHLDAASSAFMIQETFEEFFHPPWSKELLIEPLTIADGEIGVPDKPGLGIELDSDILREHSITDEYR